MINKPHTVTIPIHFYQCSTDWKTEDEIFTIQQERMTQNNIQSDYPLDIFKEYKKIWAFIPDNAIIRKRKPS